MAASDAASALPPGARAHRGYVSVILLVLVPSALVALAMSSLYS